MRYFLTNILLGILWLTLTGDFNFINFAFGIFIGYITLYLTQIQSDSQYFTKVPKVFSFIGYFIWALAKANIKLAYDVVTPYKHYHMNAGIVAIPLSAETDVEITFLANFITLTPGTLCIDVSDDRSVMYVHFMYFENEIEARRQIKEGFEKRLLEVLR
jgi:multicomponent Na+:H+ antiporter subunit E